MAETVCQVLIAFQLMLTLALLVKWDCVGRPARRPAEHLGIGIFFSMVAVALHFWLYWGAGAFDRVFAF